MLELVIDNFLIALAAYLIIGVLFSFYFLASGVNKIDEGVKEAPWHFKLLIWPGTVLMWSVLLVRIVKK